MDYYEGTALLRYSTILKVCSSYSEYWRAHTGQAAGEMGKKWQTKYLFNMPDGWNLAFWQETNGMASANGMVTSSNSMSNSRGTKQNIKWLLLLHIVTYFFRGFCWFHPQIVPRSQQACIWPTICFLLYHEVACHRCTLALSSTVHAHTHWGPSGQTGWLFIGTTGLKGNLYST